MWTLSSQMLIDISEKKLNVFFFFFYHWRLCKSGAGQTTGLSGRWRSHSGSPCPGWAGSGEAPPRAGPALQETDQMVSVGRRIIWILSGYTQIRFHALACNIKTLAFNETRLSDLVRRTKESNLKFPDRKNVSLDAVLSPRGKFALCANL